MFFLTKYESNLIVHGFCPTPPMEVTWLFKVSVPSPPPPSLRWLNLKICQNFVWNLWQDIVMYDILSEIVSYWYIIWKDNTTNRGLNLKNSFYILCLLCWGFHLKPVFFLKRFKWWPVLWCLDYSALSDLRIYGPDSWRSNIFRIGSVLAQIQALCDSGIK